MTISCRTTAAEASQLRLGYFPNITHAQALYAKATGELEKQLGVPIRWSSFNAGPTAIEGMLTDAIDGTFVGPSPAINGYVRSRGDKYVIVSGSAAGGAGLVLRRGAQIRTDKDFGGKIIATPQFGNTQDIAARRWFSQRGYAFKEKGGSLTLIPLTNPDQFTLFKKGEIDGAWTVEPWLARLEEEANGVLFLDEKILWPQGKYATTVLILNRNFLRANPQLTHKLLSGLVEITLKINADKASAAMSVNAQLKQETGKALTDRVIAKSIERVEFTWDPVISSIRKSAEEAFKLGLLPSAPELNGLFQTNVLHQVLKERHLLERLE